jgi:hypothetical protein
VERLESIRIALAARSVKTSQPPHAKTPGSRRCPWLLLSGPALGTYLFSAEPISVSTPQKRRPQQQPVLVRRSAQLVRKSGGVHPRHGFRSLLAARLNADSRCSSSEWGRDVVGVNGFADFGSYSAAWPSRASWNQESASASSARVQRVGPSRFSELHGSVRTQQGSMCRR